MSSSINTIDVCSPIIDFFIFRKNEEALIPYILDWDGGTAESDGTFTFDEDDPAYFVPVNEMIGFLPNFQNILNNQIIQYKWSFGDGTEKIINDNHYLVFGDCIFSEAVNQFLIFNTNQMPQIGQEIIANNIPLRTKITNVQTMSTGLYFVTIDSNTTGASGGTQSITLTSIIPEYHLYDAGLAPIYGGNNCVTATLTAIDRYQRHFRVYKQIYLKAYS